jgi:hypothetical protein
MLAAPPVDIEPSGLGRSRRAWRVIEVAAWFPGRVSTLLRAWRTVIDRAALLAARAS